MSDTPCFAKFTTTGLLCIGDSSGASTLDTGEESEKVLSFRRHAIHKRDAEPLRNVIKINGNSYTLFNKASFGPVKLQVFNLKQAKSQSRVPHPPIQAALPAFAIKRPLVSQIRVVRRDEDMMRSGSGSGSGSGPASVRYGSL
jgi:hypothetical protein